MEPAVIRSQMLMKQFTMMKFFFSALATSKYVTLRTMEFLPTITFGCCTRNSSTLQTQRQFCELSGDKNPKAVFTLYWELLKFKQNINHPECLGRPT